MKIKPRTLLEYQRFDSCNTAKFRGERSTRGLEQFHLRESTGQEPASPDPYYVHLIQGKKWWEWTLNLLAEDYLTLHWDGWLMKALDFNGDSGGFRQLRQRCGCSPCDPIHIIESCLVDGEFCNGLGI